MRRQSVERRCLERETETVVTIYGPIGVKVAHLPDGSTKRAPEYEDWRRAAEVYGVPLRDVYSAVLNPLMPEPFPARIISVKYSHQTVHKPAHPPNHAYTATLYSLNKS